MANSVDSDQTAPIGAVCSGSKLFASILNLSVMLGNNLQQTTSADVIFQTQVSNCFLRGVGTSISFLRKPIATCDFAENPFLINLLILLKIQNQQTNV